MTQKVLTTTKKEGDIFDTFKIKNFWAVKDKINRVERQPTR